MIFTSRYQVFLSSTYTDLKEERAEVIQALWELDCIPTGMEAFLASNMSQWDIIQRVIDQCDYYVLIIGGRYGSVSEGVSYTEKEFNYAKKLQIPILAFVHGNPDEIASGKTEADNDLRNKLMAFRARVMGQFPVREWTTAHELGGLVSRSLVQEMRRTPRPGWVRNDSGSPIALLEKVNALTEENSALKERISGGGSSHIPVEELASGSDTVSLTGTVSLYDVGQSRYGAETFDWNAEVSWDVVFRNIGPGLITEDSENYIRKILANFYQFEPDYPYEKLISASTIDQESFVTILIQLRALGLIDKGSKKRQINDKQSYWQLTEYGDRYLVSLMAQRKDSAGNVVVAPTGATSPE